MRSLAALTSESPRGDAKQGSRRGQRLHRGARVTEQNAGSDAATFHRVMAEHMKWAKLHVTIQEIAEDNTDLVRDLANYDPAATVPLLAGLLTLPDYQSNCIRFEILVVLAVRHCHGRKRAHVEQAKQWFLQIGKSRCALAEDPAEDVFVSLVHDDQGNYRLLEGVWEGSAFYTQRVLDVIATMPDDGEFGADKELFSRAAHYFRYGV